MPPRFGNAFLPIRCFSICDGLTFGDGDDELKGKPAFLNEDAYGKGWIALIEPTALDSEIGDLQGADGLEDWVKKEYAEKKAE